ncbi:MAG: ATP-binding cassette domain-containing protein, partial [Alphaproteobacteria bacterium]|nr:ATP-binding cassette domain-containing protein [Alphaproteobacteria bacterium]
MQLRLEDVTSYYGKTPILQNIDLGIAEGHCLAVLGRNGVGKTTLVRTIMGLTTRMTGKLSIAGEDATNKETHERSSAGVGYIPQGRGILPKFSVRENILLGTFARLRRETLADRPHHISGEARPLRFYVECLARAVRATPRIGLRELLLEINPEPSRETLVGSFCAILELIKLGVISASQDGHRGEIRVEFMADVDADLDHLLDAARFEDEDSEAQSE